MTVIALASLKHAPGVTTLSVALAQAFADAGVDVILIDADPMGGDVAAYTGLPAEPGLMTLAAACRHPDANLDISPHLSALPNGGAAVLSSGIAGQSSAVLAVLASRLAAGVRSWADVAVVDCGRLTNGSPALALVSAADHLVVIAEPTLAGIVHVRDEIDRLHAINETLELVLAGSGPYRADEVEAVTSVPVLGTIPRDGRGATGVMGGLVQRAARRTPLGRAARTLADELLIIGSDRTGENAANYEKAASG